MSQATESVDTYARDRQSPEDRNADTGRSTAAEKFLEDVRNTQTGTNGGAFVNEVTTELEHQGLLPMFALDWSRSADTADFDRDGNKDEDMFSVLDMDGSGDVTTDELDYWRNRTEPGTIENKLLTELRSDYDTYRYAHSTDSQNGITRNDVNAQTTLEEEAANTRNRVSDASARLLANPTMFDAIDVAAHGGDTDGKISKNDLGNFIEDWENGNRPAGVTESDVEAMRYLRDNWDSDAVKALRDDYISREKLRSNFGLAADGSGDQGFIQEVAQTNSQLAEDLGIEIQSTEAPQQLTAEQKQKVAEFLNSEVGQARLRGALGEDGKLSQQELTQLIQSFPTDDPDARVPEGLELLQQFFPQVAGEDSLVDQEELAALGVNTEAMNSDNQESLTDEERQQVVDFLNSEQGQDSLAAVIGDDGILSAEEAQRLLRGYQSQDPEGGPPPGAEILAEKFSQLAGEDGMLTPEEMEALGITAPGTETPEPSLIYADKYTVEPGQGFDVIARDAFTQLLGRRPTPAEEIALSEMIAAGNGNDRSYSNGYIHPGDQLVIPNLQELNRLAEAAGIPLVDFIRQQRDAFVAAVQQDTGSDPSTDTSTDSSTDTATDTSTDTATDDPLIPIHGRY